MQRTIPIFVLMLCITKSGDAQMRVDHYGDALPEGAVARLGTVRLRHAFGGARVVYSPEGKSLASTGRFPGVCLWDAETGKLLPHVAAMRSASAVAFSSDGSKLFTGYHLIDTATGKVIRQFKVRSPGDSAAFSPDGFTLASSDYEAGSANIILWDANTGKDIRALSSGITDL